MKSIAFIVAAIAVLQVAQAKQNYFDEICVDYWAFARSLNDWQVVPADSFEYEPFVYDQIAVPGIHINGPGITILKSPSITTSSLKSYCLYFDMKSNASTRAVMGVEGSDGLLKVEAHVSGESNPEYKRQMILLRPSGQSFRITITSNKGLSLRNLCLKNEHACYM